MKISIHINFAGNCEEALRFYAESLGGEVASMLRYGDSSAADQVPEKLREKIVHGNIHCANIEIAGADVPGDYQPPAGIQLLIQVDNADQVKNIFARLSVGGNVDMEPQQTFWSSCFCMFRDKFGVIWEVNSAA